MMLQNKMPAIWKAKWIDPEVPHEQKERQPASVLRRRFTADNTENAILYITCHGLYEAKLNGRRVGDFVLAPGTGEYRKRLTVQAYDVSALLRAGENEIVVTLGDGWYRGNNGIDGLNCLFGSDLALLCQLELDGMALCGAMRTGKPASAARSAAMTWNWVSALTPGGKRSGIGTA